MIINVLTYLEQAVRRAPDRAAVADASSCMSYRELWERVTRCGSALYARIGGGRPVAVELSRSAADIVAFFSVLYSGNFYVPLDTSLPRERQDAILAKTAPATVISGGSLEEREPLSAPPYLSRRDCDPVYVIFTSGSTGTPKGVAVSHRSVIDMVEQFSAAFRFEDGAVFGNQAPFDFDVSVKDIFLSLRHAGRLEILEKKLFSFPRLLIDRLNERRVDTLIWAVPALNIIARLKAFETALPEYVRSVMFSGEVMPPKTLEYWMRRLPDTRFVNLYGPTEITCNCTYYIIDGEAPEPLPIGRAFENCEVFLLDGDAPVTADGVIGEICVSGSCVALGYYGDEALTAAAFPQNPLRTEWPERIYRTGDLGCYKDGLLCYMGRKDTQIKHMGHRIELAEIELCAARASGVEAAACVYAEQKIRLFYTGDGDEKALFTHLRERLPRYMLPAAITRLDAFPQTRTGKIDRKKLYGE